jgi:uncharacterized protein (UPF0332 family)
MTGGEYVVYRMNRAKQSLQVAEKVLQDGFIEDAVNRMYYAIYYAVSALLYTRKLHPKTHLGMKALFSKEFVKNNLITGEQAQIYSTIFAKRFEADYEDFFTIDTNSVNNHLAEAKAFILLIENIINNSPNND